MAQIIDALKKFSGKVGIEVLALTIAEELRGLAKRTTQDSAQTAKARWLGLADKAVFSHELAILGPIKTRIIVSFLEGEDRKKVNLFRLIITSLDTSEQRQKVLHNICDMNDDSERHAYLEQTIAKQEHLEQAAKWLLKNAGALAEQIPEFAKWLKNIMEREYRRLGSAANASDQECGRLAAQLHKINEVKRRERRENPPGFWSSLLWLFTGIRRP